MNNKYDRYARYEDKMHRTVAVLDWIRGHRVRSFLIVAAFIILLAAGFILPGFVAKPLALTQASYTYGEAPVWDAKVWFRPWYVEFAAAGVAADSDNGEWTTVVPLLPGDYQVRLVKENALRQEVRKNPVAFSIVPRPIDVVSAEEVVEYGQTPKLAADTVYGEKVASYDVTYDDLTQTSTFVTVLADTVCIVDINGIDVTDRYVLQTPAMPIDFTPKTIVLYAGDADFIYDGTAQQCLNFTADSPTAFADQYFVVTSATSLQYPQWMEHRTYLGVVDRLKSEFQSPEIYFPDIQTYDPAFTPFVDDPEHALNRYTVGGIVVTAANEQTYVVLDGQGRDCSANYRFVCVPGKLTIDRRDVSVKAADTESVVYDGQPHACSNAVSCIDGTSPAQGETAVARAVYSFTDVGRYVNTLAVWVVNPDTCHDTSGFYNMIITAGSFEITKRPITVTIPDVTKVYDGNGQSTCEPVVSGGMGLVAGHSLYIQTYPDVSDVGAYENKITVGVKDSSGTDVTRNYDITYEYGTLTIEPRPLHLTTASAKKEYDGKALSAATVTISEETPLADGDFVKVIEYPTVTRCSEGTVVNALTVAVMHGRKKDVTHNYAVTFTYGSLQVTPRPLTVRLHSIIKEYDATPLTSNDYSITAGSLPVGHTLSLVCSGSQTEPGSSPRSFTGDYTALDAAGMNVSDCFTIACTYCDNLIVVPRSVRVFFADFKKEYDGSPLYAQPYYTLHEGDLLPGHRFSCTVNAALTEIGWIPYGCETFRVTDENGRDVTAYYQAVAPTGSLTVRPVTLCVSSQNVTQYYTEGAVLQDDYYWISGGHLLPGHAVSCTVTGTLDAVGVASNTISAVSVYEIRTGKDVSAFYDVITVPGRLEFLPQETQSK